MDIWSLEVKPDQEHVLCEYIIVMNTCRHHYTGEMMRYIRRDYIADLTNQSYSEYEFVNEAQWEALLARRIEV